MAAENAKTKLYFLAYNLRKLLFANPFSYRNLDGVLSLTLGFQRYELVVQAL